MKNSIGRYSKYIKPITLIVDLLIIFVLTKIIFTTVFNLSITLYLLLGWIVTSWLTKFYEVYRITKVVEVGVKICKQMLVFLLLTFAYIGIEHLEIEKKTVFIFIGSLIIGVSLFKLFVFFSLRQYRKKYSGNHRNVIIVGKCKRSLELKEFFENKKQYGYNLLKQFEDFNFQELEQFFYKNNVDEIYLSLENLKTKHLKEIILFTDNYFAHLKYIPSDKGLMVNSGTVQYYDYIPIIPEHKTPLEDYFNRTIKRIFDIVFSLLVIIFVMSWLYPLVAIIIKMESKGPVIFKQKRNGLFYKEFDCYKFRSMVVNDQADTQQVVKNDIRITKFGSFLRKSSIDEMPQFFNVLLGNMSVCGPRPHMLKLTQEYEKQVHRYRLRHLIKPGITGMAQTHGYRGEITSQNDIVNRVKYDIFYIENWNLLLDIRIIYLTIKNAIKGEKKAY